MYADVTLIELYMPTYFLLFTLASTHAAAVLYQPSLVHKIVQARRSAWRLKRYSLPRKLHNSYCTFAPHCLSNVRRPSQD